MTTAARPRLAPDVRWGAAVLLVAALLVAGGATVSLARFTSSDGSTAAFTTDVLAPPTDLTATGGTTVTLSWIATPKTWATGYTVWRASSPSGTYSQIASVSPRTTVTYLDSPAVGTYYYQVRAYYQSWTSAFEGPVSATVASPASTTGFIDCVAASNAADTTDAGDNDGYQANADRACSSNGTFAADASSGTGGTESCGVGAVPDVRKDRHRWWGYAFGLPAAVTSIDGIEVTALLRLTSNGGTTNLCTQLSSDGGMSWTTIESQAVSGGNDWTSYTFGGPGYTWGRAWSVGDFGTDNFRVRVIGASTQTTKVFQLDALQVQVTYTP